MIRKYLLPLTSRRRLPITILLAGIIISVLAIVTGPRPRKQPSTEREQMVKAIKATPSSIAPKITGYGEAKPSKTWKAIAQVDGKVAWKSPKLKSGEFFKSGETMLKLDESETILKMRSCEADIKKYQAKIEELNNTRTNWEAQLEVLKKVLEFNTKELKRQEGLHKAHAVAAVTVENQEITVLQQRNNIITMESSLRLLPAQIDYQKAELSAAQANLEQSKLTLDYAKVTAPFDCRVSTASVEERQYVATGQEMFTADSIDEMEIPVQFSIDQMGLLLTPPPGTAVEKKEFTEKHLPPDWKIRVKVNGGTNAIFWNGEFRRMASGIDTTTRMVSMVVAVPNPYGRNTSTPSQPLDKGFFCTVEISAAPQTGLIAVPRYALHDGNLYIANKESRLEIRPVKVAYNLEQTAIIASGLKAGETVVISDLVPAIKGMKLNVSIDRANVSDLKSGSNVSEVKK